MKVAISVVGSLLFLAIGAFCAVGFLATFEPTSRPGQFFGFRIVYSIVGLASIFGIAALITSAVRR